MTVLGSNDLGNGRYVMIVNHDPLTVSTDAPKGSIIIRQDTAEFFRKLDDGDTTNVVGEATAAVAGFMSAVDKDALSSAFPTGRFSFNGLTRAGGLDINVGAGVGFVQQAGVIKKVTWSADVVSVPTDVSKEIGVDDTGTIFLADSVDIEANIILGNVVTDGLKVIFLSYHDADLVQKVRDAHLYTRDAVGPVVISGGLASDASPPSFGLDVSESNFYIADDRKENVPAGAPATWTYWYQDGSGGWTTVDSVATLDAAQYDDGSGTLAVIPASEYKRDLLYICPVGSNSTPAVEFHVFYGQSTHATQSEAESSDLPNVPDFFRNFALRSTGIVIQQGGSAPASFVDSRPRIGQLAESIAITDHGLLGGLVDDDHTQYLRHDGTRAMTGDLDLGLQAIVNVGNVDGVDVSDHKGRHISGGGDAFAATDLLEAVVKRLRESGGQDLLLGAIADTEVLRRSGTGIIGGTYAPATKQVLFGTRNNTSGNYASNNVGGTGAGRFTFLTPHDFVSLVSLQLVGIVSAGADGAARDIDFFSSYGAIGELSTTHGSSDSASTYDLTGQTDKFYAFDISSLYASLAAGDFAGLLVDHKGIGGGIDYVGILLRYT